MESTESGTLRFSEEHALLLDDGTFYTRDEILGIGLQENGLAHIFKNDVQWYRMEVTKGLDGNKLYKVAEKRYLADPIPTAC